MTLSVHKIHADGDDDMTTSVCVIALIDRQNCELYDVDNENAEIDARIPEHTVAVHVTDDLIFASCENRCSVKKISPISSFTSSVHVLARRWLAGSKCSNARTFTPRARRACQKVSPRPVPRNLRSSTRDVVRVHAVDVVWGVQARAERQHRVRAASSRDVNEATASTCLRVQTRGRRSSATRTVTRRSAPESIEMNA